ncbi:hypothetical protein Kpol_1018p5 [Vanderwaltozyma polyspora DSM 70294]|uniref:Peptidase S8/S53 domain-containing protein n=1 Tax=Vanderwaltozyma polyspora (strain ATCC 22028 / DSM 70294 / BCRC 21397 / CBS 2163 / NBRC 10782 / NRRL Y-8283 / UCD 57-17) TaxID=436907 RepID=A7TDK8_VANPO|nr:uncharacterized protein Kpol_1018p5 [Vanderwaltozyma polyspora DSM 70294]EDO19478.1 hypothetical protein Kpol_1018p5 [Vanderwaltozyma polyspora DSM 70294]
MKTTIRFLLLLYICPLIVGEEYLIKLKKSESIQSFLKSTKSQSLQIKDDIKNHIRERFTFGAFRALVIDLPNDMIEKLKKNPTISEIIPNLKVNAFANSSTYSELLTYSDKIIIQREAPRHLSRLSRRGQLPYDINNIDRYDNAFDYYFDAKYQGSSVNAYIIDTGIYKEHPEFEGRVKFAIDLTQEGPGDENGHGTHIAGIVGSKTFGVAKKVNIIDVKALDKKGQGQLSTILKALEFTIRHCKESVDKKCVANLSFGAIRTAIIDEAIKEAHNAGIVLVVAAGNSNIDACWNSPASSKDVITVGAFDDRTETIARFSNWGSCVDVFAPGVKVKSLSHINGSDVLLLSGTSMASPSVSGIAAILLDKGLNPKFVKSKIIESSTKNIFHQGTIMIKPNTPNLIVFNGIEKMDDSFEGARFPRIDFEGLINELKSYRVSVLDGSNMDNYSLGLDILNSSIIDSTTF